MALNPVMDALRAIVLLPQIVRNAMIIQVNADANRVSQDEHVINVYQAIGTIHPKGVCVSEYW